MTAKELDLWTNEIARVIGEVVQPLVAELATVKAELAALREQTLKAKGTWKSGEHYVINDVVNWSGSWWRCLCAHTSSGPSLDHDLWRLEVKRGRDGRDAKAVA